MSRKQTFPHGILIESDDDIDLKYRVANNAERDALITSSFIKKGHVIFDESTGLRWELKTYPTPGSLTGVTWKRVTTEVSSSLTSPSTEIVATSKAVKDLKDLIDSFSVLDQNTPPVFIDGPDADNLKDSIRFTFSGGSTVDVSIKDLVDLGAFKTASQRSSTQFIVDYTTLGGSTIPLDLTSWFNLQADNDKVLINGNIFTLVKNPANNIALKTTMETNDVVIDGFWDNTTYWGKSKYIGGNIALKTSYIILDEIENI